MVVLAGSGWCSQRASDRSRVSMSDSRPLHLRMTLEQLADVQPAEDASRIAALRYHPAGGAHSNSSADSAATVAATPDYSWMPTRIRSKEQLEQSVRLVQDKLHAFNVLHQQQQQLECQTMLPFSPLHNPSLPASSASSSSSASAAAAAAAAVACCSALSLYPPPPALPLLPSWGQGSLRALPARLRALQAYLRSFEYNHLGAEFHPVAKNKNWDRYVMTAKDIIKEALPIKCERAIHAARVTAAKQNRRE